ncbi:metallophosphoesterase [Saccharibacillus sp. JS10]|uniref:metallophosphoesterase n=1 Tax=Saccharibacillus sp. JS10 TaxID=2950552 RepID=UPI00210A78A9|nr:metallophosphoesterase [Saccharibacillus sp. JS10]MCQ4087308.1 metallophosphoesterase [Saccharibacillus sp. JS10]
MTFSFSTTPLATPFQRILAISDIHGHEQGLDLLLAEAGYDPSYDLLILGGDYIDTDPATWRILDRIIQLTTEGAIALPGNHELKLLALEGVARQNIQHHLDWLNHLPLYFAVGDFIFVHAGFRPGVLLEQQTMRDMIEIREAFWNSDGQAFQEDENIAGRTIVFGHTPTFKLGAPLGQPWIQPGKLGIDTGAKHRVRLTLLDLTNSISYSCSTSPEQLYLDLRRQVLQLGGSEVNRTSIPEVL